MHIVFERLYGNLQIQDDILRTRLENIKKLYAESRLPITYIEGKPCWGDGFAGLQMRAVKANESQDNIRTIYHDNIPCGRVWENSGSKYIILQNIHGNVNRKLSREEQIAKMFARAEIILKNEGANYRHVVRTWIFLSNILEWYHEFNLVRNIKYKQFQLIPDQLNHNNISNIYLPASTGIQGENNDAAAAVMDLYAIIQDKNPEIQIKFTEGIKQKSAFHYGSAFSRAVTVHAPDNTQILISGTAAIDDEGKSLYHNNPKSQIEYTIGVVEALMQNKGATIDNIFDTTIYLKRSQDLNTYYQIKTKYGLKNTPSICVLADVCRDELLFELDAFVVLNNKSLNKNVKSP
jgi:enamine deaminase RidA (YjgF/YER057c/UK114 family)